ncbi:MAG: hypothetical protein H6636_09005 [Anaerolineales bacterium]|nr:hypothetical protein [Anaerolineales bacterium]
MTDTPEIDSFIIRIVHSHPEETSAQLRGSIRHIQTNEEKAFTHWQEVEQFMKRFIPLDGPLFPPEEA